MQPLARIRALCILFALLPLFAQKASAWSELLVKGAVGSDTWSTIATLTKQDDKGNSYSGTIDASSWEVVPRCHSSCMTALMMVASGGVTAARPT